MNTTDTKNISIKSSDKPTVYHILFIIGMCHLLNDSLQAVMPAMFPILEKSLSLTFTQLVFIAFTLNIVVSVLQTVIRLDIDKGRLHLRILIGLSYYLLGL